uniref:glycylpeptide N-tetradecanoyltransferase n=1 Tax=viral metagenome TaxID=1070528 RepID=A0A6C0EBD9_9ZZZZ
MPRKIPKIKKTLKSEPKKDTDVVEKKNDVKEEKHDPNEKFYKANHKFWKNKPVVDFKEYIRQSEEIEDLSKREIYSQDTPLKLPLGFRWDLNSDLNDVTEFLKNNYLVDKTEKFRLNYTSEFLRWSLYDGFILTLKKEDDICGCIGVNYKNVIIYNKKVKMAEATYLCTDVKLRSKNMASVLIDEAVRIACHNGVSNGCFTTERKVPSPITKLKYYHRPINFEKLNDAEFINKTFVDVDKKIDYFSVKEKSYLEDATLEDIDKIYDIYLENLKQFTITAEYTKEQLQHYLFSDFSKTYVYKIDGQIVDFGSFYNLDYIYKKEITEDEKLVTVEDNIKTSYLLLSTSQNILTEAMLKELIIKSSENNSDVFNLLDMMDIGNAICAPEFDIDDYDKIYGSLKFMRGNAHVYFYLFNWKCQPILPNQICWNVF